MNSFDNDDAADWAWTLDESRDCSVVEATLAAADVGDDEYLEAPVAAAAVAAADAVARLRGAGGEESAYSKSVDAWVKRVDTEPPAAIVSLAVRVLARIDGSQSELRELWEESDELSAWQASLGELRERLTKSI